MTPVADIENAGEADLEKRLMSSDNRKGPLAKLPPPGTLKDDCERKGGVGRRLGLLGPGSLKSSPNCIGFEEM
jgi:hypothetical protein